MTALPVAQCAVEGLTGGEQSGAGGGRPRGAHSPAGELALMCTSLGEHEQALDWLERAVDERRGWVPVYLKVEAHVDPLRSGPRFKALLKKAGFDE